MPTDQMIIFGLAALVVVLALVAAYLAGSRGRGRAGAQVGQSLAPIALPNGAESLAPVFSELRTQLHEVAGKVEEVRATARTEAVREEERRRAQDQAFEVLQRLSATLLGSAKAGATGERIVDEMLEALPPQWRVTNHVVGGQRVEFGIKLPDGLILPIDSKVVAQKDLDALNQTEAPDKRDSLEKKIRREALDRVAEVRQYVDERTPGFAIAAVSDALYHLCGPILPKAYAEHRALIVPYSLLGPFVLMVYEQHRRGVDLDAARLANLVTDIESHLDKAAQSLNSHLGGALVQLNNARDSLSREMGEAARAVALLRSTAGSTAATQPAHKEKVRA